jgi:hypothetical protein
VALDDTGQRLAQARLEQGHDRSHRAAVFTLRGNKLGARQRAGHVTQAVDGELLDTRPVDQAQVRAPLSTPRNQPAGDGQAGGANHDTQSQRGLCP